MYINNIVNFQEPTTILNAHMEKSLEMYRMHLLRPLFAHNLNVKKFYLSHR